MKIAYFSPFKPIKSGISDFSEELVMELKNLVDIDIFVDGYTPSNKKITENFKIYNIRDIYNNDIRKQYDHLIYHIGNNAKAHSAILKAFEDFPGICELHDVSLHHFIAEETIDKGKYDEYVEIMNYCHGDKGKSRALAFLEGRALPPWEEDPLTYTVSKHIIDRAKALIVHSDFAKQMVLGINSTIPVVTIPHHTSDIVDNFDLFKQTCRHKLGIDDRVTVLASFGFASCNKRIPQILEALARFKTDRKKDFMYYIVGKNQCEDLEKRIKELNLVDNVIITGFTSLDMFKCYMGACDIALNLRYPTMGESSGSIHRLLGMGKPVIVTDIGSFQEFPDDVVVKVTYGDSEVNEIFKAIDRLTKDKGMMHAYCQKAHDYAKKHYDIQITARMYADYFQALQENRFQKDRVDSFIDRLFEIGLADEKYIDHLSDKRALELVY